MTATAPGLPTHLHLWAQQTTNSSRRSFPKYAVWQDKFDFYAGDSPPELPSPGVRLEALKWRMRLYARVITLVRGNALGQVDDFAKLAHLSHSFLIDELFLPREWEFRVGDDPPPEDSPEMRDTCPVAADAYSFAFFKQMAHSFGTWPRSQSRNCTLIWETVELILLRERIQRALQPQAAAWILAQTHVCRPGDKAGTTVSVPFQYGLRFCAPNKQRGSRSRLSPHLVSMHGGRALISATRDALLLLAMTHVLKEVCAAPPLTSPLSPRPNTLEGNAAAFVGRVGAVVHRFHKANRRGSVEMAAAAAAAASPAGAEHTEVELGFEDRILRVFEDAKLVDLASERVASLRTHRDEHEFVDLEDLAAVAPPCIKHSVCGSHHLSYKEREFVIVTLAALKWGGRDILGLVARRNKAKYTRDGELSKITGKIKNGIKFWTSRRSVHGMSCSTLAATGLCRSASGTEGCSRACGTPVGAPLRFVSVMRETLAMMAMDDDDDCGGEEDAVVLHKQRAKKKSKTSE